MALHPPQRFVSCIDRRSSPDTDRETLIRLPRRGDNLYSRRTSGKCRPEIIHGNIFYIFCQNSGYSSQLYLSSSVRYSLLQTTSSSFSHLPLKLHSASGCLRFFFPGTDKPRKRVLKYLIRMIDFGFLYLPSILVTTPLLLPFHHHTDTYHRLPELSVTLSCRVSGSSPLCRFCVFLPDILGDTDSFVIDIEKETSCPRNRLFKVLSSIF